MQLSDENSPGTWAELKSGASKRWVKKKILQYIKKEKSETLHKGNAGNLHKILP